MNEKFFDLKKEKQDRMINAALKIFTKNGYSHASTDDIVKEAGISKGLLFHYFTNKIGLYSFIYDYSTRLIALELTSSIDKSNNDYFSLHLQIKEAESNVMKSYPYMVAFVNSVKDELVIEAVNELSGKTNQVKELIEEYFKHANISSLRRDIDLKILDNMIEYIAAGTMKKALQFSEPRPDIYYNEMKEYLIQLKNMSM